MDELKLFEKFESELTTFANKHSVTRLKISTANFDREYQRGQDGQFLLVSTKAVIRVLGKVTKVPIGDDQECKNYEEAYAATKRYWSEYYKKVRASRSPAKINAEHRRQKRYREARKVSRAEAESRQ